MFYFHHFISNSQRLLMEVRRHNSLLHICCIYFILFTVKRYVYILSFVTQQRSLTLGTHAAKLRLIVLGTHAAELIHSSSLELMQQNSDSSSLELMQQNSYTHRPWNSCSRTHTLIVLGTHAAELIHPCSPDTLTQELGKQIQDSYRSHKFPGHFRLNVDNIFRNFLS